MEDQIKNGAESEEICESFLCCVCLDLLYKPIVLSCGHVSCFWCVHRSMDALCESHCPICRHPYSHFPTICPLLHFLLLKIHPIAYKRREKQILDEEERCGLFSPQFDTHLCDSTGQSLDHSSTSAIPPITNSPCNTSLDVRLNKQAEPSSEIEQSIYSSLSHDNCTTNPRGNSNFDFGVPKTVGAEDKTLTATNSHENYKQVVIADVLCVACKQLLIRPAVLNCGHVYCEACVINLADEKIRCKVCDSLHPGGLPKVCLEFDHFLEGQFPQEYVLRRDVVQLKQKNFQQEGSNACSKGSRTDASGGAHISRRVDHSEKVHIGVGCDFCGMYPIVGDRYKCKDCMEEVGFDLCGDCYRTCSKLPGRFNQQHRPDHNFELMSSNIMRNIMLGLVSGHLEAGRASSVFPVLSGDALEEGLERGPPPSLSNDDQEQEDDDNYSESPR